MLKSAKNTFIIVSFLKGCHLLLDKNATIALTDDELKFAAGVLLLNLALRI